MKKVLSLLTAFIIAASLCVTAFASEESKSYIIDNANLLTDNEEDLLYDKVVDIYNKYDYAVVILTEKSIGDEEAAVYADDYYDYNGYQEDGMLFLFSTEYGDYYTSTKGSGITAISDNKKDELHSRTTPYLRDADYYMAFETYLDTVSEFLAQADAGTPYDSQNSEDGISDETLVAAPEEDNKLVSELIVFAVAVIIAFIVVSIMKKGMNNVAIKTEAREYMKKDSLNITNKDEIFLHKEVVKVAKPKENTSGSTTHTSSSGSTHGGGGGRL